MSIHRLESLDCFCNCCHRSFGAIDSEPATSPGNTFPTNIHEARKVMKEYGWKYRNRIHQDLCPDCVLIYGGKKRTHLLLPRPLSIEDTL